MLNPLPTTLNSYSKSARATVESLIRDMKLDKFEVQGAITQMSAFSVGSDFAAARIGPFSLMDRQVLVELFRDSFLKVQSFFVAMNSVGLAISSMVNLFQSEIEKIERDIADLEIYINNYEFTSGKDDLYNFNYIERFVDLLGSYKYDGVEFVVPDRDNTYFPSGGNGFVDSGIGAFKFGASVTPVNVIKKIESIGITTNFDNYVTSNSDPENLFNDNLMDSWNVTIKSPTILTSTLSDYAEYFPYEINSYNGAQAAIDVFFTEGMSMDTIRFSPNSANDFQLMQVVVFSDDTWKSLLTKPILLRGLREIYLPRTAVTRVLFIFNQPSYTRSKPTPVTSELNSKAVHNFVQEQVNERKKRFSKYQDIVYWYFLNRSRFNMVAKNKSEYDFYSSRIPAELDSFANMIFEELYSSSNFGLDFKYEFSRSPVLMGLIQNVFKSITKDSSLIKSTSYIESYGNSNVSQRLLNYAGFLYGANSTNYYDVKEQFYKYPIEVGGVSTVVQSLLLNESKDSYEYLFSLKAIEFYESETTQVNKACFVSKKISTNEQVLAVKAKIDEIESASLPGIEVYDLKEPISYELSISNEEVPTRESNWAPLVFNNDSQIKSEVVFFDITDYSAQLRFYPIVDTIFLYRDGKLTSSFRYDLRNNKIYLTDPTLYSPGNIFCVKYDLDLVKYNPREIDFAKLNIMYDSVKTFGDSLGEGQKFNKTDMNNSVTLDFTPYVNTVFARNSSYSLTYGTVFNTTVGYSPVKIKLNSGSFAFNLTNYTGRAFDVNLNSTNNLAFVQTGKSIVFNRGIAEPFTVYYDYIPNSLRFRFIMRKNLPDLDVPVKADNIILKMKTTNFDPYYDKLNLGTAGK